MLKKKGQAEVLVLLLILALLIARPVAAQSAAFVSQNSSAREQPQLPFNLDDPPDLSIRLTPAFALGLEFTLEVEQENNFDQERTLAVERMLVSPELSLAVSYDPHPKVLAFLEVEWSRELATAERDQQTDSASLELKQAYLAFPEVATGLKLQIGRQSFKDEREWLFDEDLDALRIFYRRQRLGFEVALSRDKLFAKELLRSETRERINYYLLLGRYARSRGGELQLFAFKRDDRSIARLSPLHLGLLSQGPLVGGWQHWLALATLRGRDGTTSLRGWGLDLGLSYQSDLRWRPSLTLGYAYGSGDADPTDNIDRSYRQTGLQDNSARFHGFVAVGYYGELFDPELANLEVATVGLGIRPLRNASLDLVYHRYRQAQASAQQRALMIELSPTGVSRSLGQEIDLVAGYKLKGPELKTQLVLGYFRPGSAFPATDETAFLVKWKVKYSF